MKSPTRNCSSCDREFSIFIRPYSCELCHRNNLCSNCAIKFVLSYEPNASYLRLCNACCDKVSHPRSFKSKAKGKSKSSSMWSLASSLMTRDRSSKNTYQSTTSTSIKQQKQERQRQSIDLCQSHSVHLASPPSQPCTYCCCTQNNKFLYKAAVQSGSNPLKEQAPLFPENYDMSSTPNRKSNQKLILQHNRVSVIDDLPDAQSNADETGQDHYYLTMHPLNNLKLPPPRSILSAAPNQVALNLSINKRETLHFVGHLEKTSLCDCYTYMLSKRRQQSTATTLSANEQQQEEDESMPSNVDQANDETHDNPPQPQPQALSPQHMHRVDDTNQYCHCVTFPIVKHKKFKLLRIDLLFDEQEYNHLLSGRSSRFDDKYATINVSLYDHDSHIWTGVQIVKMQQIHAGFHVVSYLSLQCKQSYLKKSVHIVGSMAWRSAVDGSDNVCSPSNSDRLHYPYKHCDIAQLVSILTQQRYDIIDSYEAVVQQRNDTNDHNNNNSNSQPSNAQRAIAANQVNPTSSDSNSHEDPEEQHEKQPFPDNDLVDGGIKTPTKRSQTGHLSIVNQSRQYLADAANANSRGEGIRYQKHAALENNALLPAFSSSGKPPTVEIEEMEKHMLQHEISRIDSMIGAFDAILASFHQHKQSTKATQNTNDEAWDEITTSMTSSFLFNTNEIRDIQAQITDHLTRSRPDRIVSIAEKVNSADLDDIDSGSSKADCVASGILSSTLQQIPVCVSCQRCSRTILLCEPIQ